MNRNALAVCVAGAAAATVVLSSAGAATGAHSGKATITQSAIAGGRLGLVAPAYKTRFGAFDTKVVPGAEYPALVFDRPQAAVYFPKGGKRAIIITTWNKRYRTAKGIGPCSTIAEMKKAYGKAVKGSWAGTDPKDRSVVHSYVVGDNLLFATQDMRTIATVALYRGAPGHTRAGSPQAYANYVALSDLACWS